MSTIAQTLAGGMGLLGAIVLFARQETARSIERAAKRLVEVSHPSMSALYLRHLLTRRSFHELARRYGELLQPGASEETSSDLLVHHSTLTWELEHDSALRHSFWKALVASGAIIAFSLLCCGLAPLLARNPRFGYAALAAGLLGAMSCLLLYGFLLRVMFRSTPEKSDTTSEAAARS